MSHLFHSVHEQNYIMHVMQYAACIGDYTTQCHTRRGTTTTGSEATLTDEQGEPVTSEITSPFLSTVDVDDDVINGAPLQLFSVSLIFAMQILCIKLVQHVY